MHRIYVAGDVVADHHIYKGDRPCPTRGKIGTCICRQRGGAGLLAELLDEVCADAPGLQVVDAAPPVPGELHFDRSLNHAYTIWRAFDLSRKDSKSDCVWRVSEAVGYGQAADQARAEAGQVAAAQKGKIDVLVIDDANLGYRDNPKCWPALLRRAEVKSAPWIILRMSHEVCLGDLWLRLQDKPFADKLIVVVSADDLRQSHAHISVGQTWEQTAQDLLGELETSIVCKQLLKCRHLVVNFADDGALWVDNTSRRHPIRRLIYDPQRQEGGWNEMYQGGVVGAEACLPAAIARALFAYETAAKKNAKPVLKLRRTVDLGTGIMRGLAARRALIVAGHGAVSGEPSPGFPHAAVSVEVIGDGDSGFQHAVVPTQAIPAGKRRSQAGQYLWTIAEGLPPARRRPLYGKARQIALKGRCAMHGIPEAEFGKLLTCDHIEMEGFFGIRRMMRDYVAEANPDRPLSLGVFGPPGSGKSFGIKQIAKGILGKGVPILTFNLSQFDEPAMLIGALHQVRDCVLRGDTPVVFWDEFDSEGLKWLRYMLAPMNDGEFLEGRITHPIGKSIFVFAGGTKPSMEAFRSRSDDQEAADFIKAKGPDFVSRLKGYLNVLGPNPRCAEDKVDEFDVGFPIRRAILLRVMAGRFGNAPLDIDPGLLNAFLKIEAYKHGARSLETIIKLTNANGTRPLLRCYLPPEEQLGLHVDYDRFLELVQEGMSFKSERYRLAAAVHAAYVNASQRGGWQTVYGQRFDKLPEATKMENVAAADRIPDILALAGLAIVPKSEQYRSTAKAVKDIIEHDIELLAEAEHNGWMAYKLKTGWSFAPVRDDGKKQHDLLVSYSDLSETDRNKDRSSVRSYLRLATMVDHVIIEERLDRSDQGVC